ncbi:hypothetical protein M5K25_021360 [Dendrobium thyrsiflorum]|uniref:Uncharacterized protein n=1 Tax=Dendrobium thyrsiflorum TaxID=117978 RepID=A0ABD0UCF0_DENTH
MSLASTRVPTPSTPLNRRKPGATPTMRQVYTSLASTVIDPATQEELCRGACDEAGNPKVPFSVFVADRQTAYTRSSPARWDGNRCGAYGEKGIFISTRLRGNDCASFRQVHLKAHTRRDTCPLTGSFAAKWHRRINGYDSGPSEPGDSPPNGTTKLWLWPTPICSPMALNP